MTRPGKLGLLKEAQMEGEGIYMDLPPSMQDEMRRVLAQEFKFTDRADVTANALFKIGKLLSEHGGRLSRAASRICVQFRNAEDRQTEKVNAQKEADSRKRDRSTKTVSSSSSSSLGRAFYNKKMVPSGKMAQLAICAGCGHPSINCNMPVSDYDDLVQEYETEYDNAMAEHRSKKKSLRGKQPVKKEPKLELQCFCHTMTCWLQDQRNSTCSICCLDKGGDK
jgi:hypothetical protein